MIWYSNREHPSFTIHGTKSHPDFLELLNYDLKDTFSLVEMQDRLQMQSKDFYLNTLIFVTQPARPRQKLRQPRSSTRSSDDSAMNATPKHTKKLSISLDRSQSVPCCFTTAFRFTTTAPFFLVFSQPTIAHGSEFVVLANILHIWEGSFIFGCYGAATEEQPRSWRSEAKTRKMDLFSLTVLND